QLLQGIVEIVREQRALGDVGGGLFLLVREQVAEGVLLVAADRRFQRDRVGRGSERLADLLDRHVHRRRKLLDLRVVTELLLKLSHDPKVEELAAAMDMTVEKVREAFRASANPISLETPVGSDEENTLGDLLSNQQEEAPADVAERTLLSDYLDDALEEL